MKASVFALDYDGTIAHHEALDPSVRDAIADARTRGYTVLLVTGRILDELRCVAGDLHFVDGVIAENGAVAHFPDSGHTSLLAPEVPPAFVAELRRRGIHFVLGRCLVDAAASDAPRLLEVIRDLELPLVLLFNHGRVMTLPQGISKATGLRVVLDMLRLSSEHPCAEIKVPVMSPGTRLVSPFGADSTNRVVPVQLDRLERPQVHIDSREFTYESSASALAAQPHSRSRRGLRPGGAGLGDVSPAS